VIVDEPEDAPVPEAVVDELRQVTGHPRGTNRSRLTPLYARPGTFRHLRHPCYDSPCTLFRSVILSNGRHRSPQSQSFLPGLPPHVSPEKPLVEIAGRPMIEHVYRRAAEGPRH
jgi:hypothetical protein